jgi:hypothetical protein
LEELVAQILYVGGSFGEIELPLERVQHVHHKEAHGAIQVRVVHDVSYRRVCALYERYKATEREREKERKREYGDG